MENIFYVIKPQLYFRCFCGATKRSRYRVETRDGTFDLGSATYFSLRFDHEIISKAILDIVRQLSVTGKCMYTY